MKITDIKTFLVGVSRQNWLFVKVLTDEGIYGWGEASVEGQEKAVEQAILTLARRSVIGEDPRNIEYIWQKMNKHGFWKGGFIYNTAISGIDQALWDIKGKALGVPVYELLGGAVRDKLRTYTHGNETNAAKAIAAGFAGVKSGIGGKYYDPLEAPKILDERLTAIRKEIGPKGLIAVDHHGQASVAEALKLIKVAAEHDLYFFEELIPPENTASYKFIHDNARGVPIAAGERLFSRHDYIPVFADQSLDIVQPDICHCGGITEIKKIAAMAETYTMRFAPHNPNGPVATAASMHVSAFAQNFEILEFAQTVYELPDITNMSFKPENGSFSLPSGPGLGIEIDEAALASRPYYFYQYAPRFREDGSPSEI